MEIIRANNGDEEVSTMAEENDDIDIIHNDGINRLINDTYHASSMDYNFDGYVEDVPLTEKDEIPLYGGSKTNILSAILLLVNLKVLNGLSDTCLT